MSVIERTLRKLQDAKQKGADHPAGDAAAAKESPSTHPSSPRAAAVQQRPVLVLDRVLLRAAGLVPPVLEERRLASQYRKIKRPLIAHATGRGVTRLPKGYLIMLASAMPGEGKTFTAFNLALSMANEKDLRVLLVDADVAKPQLSRLLGLEDERGLLDVLRDPQLGVESVIRQTDVPTLSFLPAGKSSADATELLASKRMEELAAQLGDRDGHRIVLFDTPPLIQTSESPVMVQMAGQVLVVVRAESTPQPVLLDALEHLQDHPAVSLVLNQSLRSVTSAYYYYGYGDDRAEESESSVEPDKD